MSFHINLTCIQIFQEVWAHHAGSEQAYLFLIFPCRHGKVQILDYYNNNMFHGVLGLRIVDNISKRRI